jgi:catechol 2,3-dioxygenase-like lactoylglutathione lyase family enzyme
MATTNGFKPKAAFSSFSVNDMKKAKEFYTKKLGLKLEIGEMGSKLYVPGKGVVWVYEKRNHKPATFTVLNLIVGNIDNSVDELTKRGVKFEHYTKGIKTDKKGIARGKEMKMGPNIAWFKDPAGNFISVIEDGK